jgi:hypothetical protein
MTGFARLARILVQEEVEMRIGEHNKALGELGMDTMLDRDEASGASSPDKAYRLSWLDADPANMISGIFDCEPGQFRLCCRGELVASGQLKRPNDGAVCNGGSFLLHDWLSWSDEPKCDFCAFGPDGRPILRRRFTGLLSKNAISAAGHYALCSNWSELTFFSLDRAEALWTRPLRMPEPDRFDICADTATINLVYEVLGSFAWHFDGTFPDLRPWRLAAFEKGDPFLVQVVARAVIDELTRDPDPELLLCGLVGIDRTLALGFEKRFGDRIPRFEALSYRLRGELLHLRGDIRGAASSYEAALRRDPKVGVLRRLKALNGSSDHSDEQHGT